MLELLLGLMRSAKVRWRRARASRRCVLGEGAVVYEPERVQAHGARRDAIVIGRNTHMRGEVLALAGGRIRIGEFCYVGEQTRIWAAELISIGDRVLIAHLATILDNTTHPLDATARHSHFRTILTLGHTGDADLSSKPVRIEDDAWIACNVVILRGVTIGRGAVVAAGSIVTKDVPPYTLVAGNPARVVRKLEPSDPERGRLPT